MRLRKVPFAAGLQAILIVLLLVSFLLIMQQTSRDLYYYGMLLLIGTTLVQIPFGNVPPESGFVRSIVYLAMGLGIVAAVAFLSIKLVPYLLDLGRG